MGRFTPPYMDIINKYEILLAVVVGAPAHPRLLLHHQEYHFLLGKETQPIPALPILFRYISHHAGYQEIDWYHPKGQSGMFYNLFGAAAHDVMTPSE